MEENLMELMDVHHMGDVISYSSKQDQHWYGDYDDVQKPYYQIRNLNIFPIEDILVKFQWKDQGK
jgi:hypothetical protein